MKENHNIIFDKHLLCTTPSMIVDCLLRHTFPSKCYFCLNSQFLMQQKESKSLIPRSWDHSNGGSRIPTGTSCMVRSPDIFPEDEGGGTVRWMLFDMMEWKLMWRLLEFGEVDQAYRISMITMHFVYVEQVPTSYYV